MITINPIIPVELLPTDKTINSTAWEVSTQPVFTIENYIVGRLALNTVNTTSATFEIDEAKLLSKILFVRVQFKFTDGSVSSFTDGFEYEIPDFIGFAYSSLIKIPSADAYLKYENIDETTVAGFLYIKSDAFRDYNNMTEHAYTYWKLIRDDGNIVFEKTAHFLLNPDDLYEIKIPIELLEDQVSYTINCSYRGKNDAVSGELAYKFQSFLSSTYFKAIIMSEFISGRVTYFRVEPKTTQYSKINFVLVDSLGNTVLEALGQETVLPKFNIPNNLNSNEVYTLKGYLTLTTGNDTPIETIAEFKIKDSLLYVVDGKVYPEKVTKSGTIDTGINNTLSSIQLDDGIILIGNNVNRTINKYRFVDGKLVFIGVAITLDESENIGPLSLNMIKLYNGNIVINYGYNTKWSRTNGNVFRLYRYNPADQSFTLLNQLRFDNMGNSTADSTSMIATPQGNVYFIPAYQYETGDVKVSLTMYKIDMATFTIDRVIPLPFVAKQYVSLVPTKDINKFIIIGGSEGNRYEVDGILTYKRENQNVYSFDSSNEIITKLPLELYSEEEGYKIDPYFYSLQGYLRADGKVVLFNATVDGPKEPIQDLFLLNTDDYTIEHISMDIPGADVYKSTIRLSNGGFLRLSTTYNQTNNVIYYPSIVGETIVAPTDEYVGTLLVQPGQTKYLTTVNFGKIIVQGDSPTNTGTLILLLAGKEFIYTYGTLILGKTQTVTPEERSNFSQIVIVNSTDAIMLDTI